MISRPCIVRSERDSQPKTIFSLSMKERIGIKQHKAPRGEYMAGKNPLMCALCEIEQTHRYVVKVASPRTSCKQPDDRNSSKCRFLI